MRLNSGINDSGQPGVNADGSLIEIVESLVIRYFAMMSIRLPPMPICPDA